MTRRPGGETAHRVRTMLIVSADGLFEVEVGGADPRPVAPASLRPGSSKAPAPSPPGYGARSGRLARWAERWGGHPDGDGRGPAADATELVLGPTDEHGEDPGVDVGDLVAVLPSVLDIVDGRPHGWDPIAGRTAALGDDELEVLIRLAGLDDGAGPWIPDAAIARATARLRRLGLVRRGDAAPPPNVTATFLHDVHAVPLEPEPAPVTPRHAVNDRRAPIHAIFHTGNSDPCLALGSVLAYARAYDGGVLNLSYAIRRPSPNAAELLREVDADPRPRILLLSDYLWSVTENLRFTAEFKRRSPSSLTIHGGPSAPKYAAECEEFLRDHPGVDVVVRGEGEVTLAEILTKLDGSWDVRALEVLADVASITFRRYGPDGTEIVRTPDRPRMQDLSELASPYLTGEFDELSPADQSLATVETNRGCPYGCTFCDWGSATNSRIRQLPLERVLGEIEWIGRRGIKTVMFADANFGIFERDVEIARAVVETFRRHGAPSVVVASFAKNTTKHIAEIVHTLNDGGIETDAAPALQTTDPTTLRIIRRKNLPGDRYDSLVQQFRDLRLPLMTDIMVGLPGSTLASFKADLDYCSARDITVRFCETFILPNSPMNDPEYRREHQIRLADDGRLVETASYTPEDYDTMLRLRKLYRAFDHFGLLRHVLRYVVWDHGVPLSAQLETIARAVADHPHEMPRLAYVARVFDLHAAAPTSWTLFFQETAAFYRDTYGIGADGPFGVVLSAQEALVPSVHREYPAAVHLAHDLVAYEHDHLRDPSSTRRLDTYGPATLVVEDPRDLRWHAPRSFRVELDADGRPLREMNSGNPGFYDMYEWELRSALTRVLYSQPNETPAAARRAAPERVP